MALATAAIIGAAVTLAATGATIAVQRDQARDAKNDARDQQGRLRKQQEDAKTQQDATLAARAQRVQQQALAGGGYDSTIGTSPLGLSSPTGVSTRSKLGE